MTPNFDHQNFPQTGFDSLLKQRTVMHHWSVLSRLSAIRYNQEATDIVHSFQRQMFLESLPSTAPSGKVA